MEVVLLPKNTPAPFEGQLFPLEKARDIRIQLIECDGTNELNASLQESVKLKTDESQLKDSEINTLLQQNKQLSDRQVETQVKSNWDNILWFGLGVLATSAAVYAVKKASN